MPAPEGQALGLHASGFQPLALYEMDEDAVNTLKLNKAGRWNIIQADIRTVDFRQYKGIDLLAGGVPCQGFSAAGAKGAEGKMNATSSPRRYASSGRQSRRRSCSRM